MEGKAPLRTLSELAASVMSEIALRGARDELIVANSSLRREAAAREAAIVDLKQSHARLRTAQRLARVGSLELSDQPDAGCHWSDEARRIMGLGGGEKGRRSAPRPTGRSGVLEFRETRLSAPAR